MVASQPRERIAAAIGVAGVHLIVGWALLVGLKVSTASIIGPALSLFDLPATAPPDPPPPVRPDPVPSRAAEGAAAPPNIRSSATPIVAPPTPLPQPSPVIAAPVAGALFDPTQGAAERPGPGTGAGGEGDGSGSGRYGDGGGAGGDETPPRWRRGRIRVRDYPEGLGEAGIQGSVEVRFTVAVTGRVTDCAVTRSSGSAVLDNTTCRLIVERFRFDPSRDGRGRPVESTIVQNHEWIVEADPDPPPPARR
ncbi:protein TonB [Sphingomonas jejuensis]|uniref:Protein TonB n=1 Tax=Sphingomonas jejuensis TaxID=904715 RepID=A0ABX0XNI1_9SPHN|nr:energy transducer TonB [Sphingomonas jejuensis]NJC34250.1 protein TonB [Sphingomonas jejuensis]